MEQENQQKTFRILSIDGGGIRGIIPARFLCELESQVSKQKDEQVRLCDYFDLICGTSTGGIIAIGLALGMSAGEILKLYTSNAQRIFGHSSMTIPKNFRRVMYPKHSNKGLQGVLQEAFAPYSNKDEITRIGHAKTRLAIPTYVASTGKARVFKTSHHEGLIRDYQIPAYQAALATSAAPTFFPAHTFEYSDTKTNQPSTLTNSVDGGIFANNPALVGFSEAVALDVPMREIMLLSIGTGGNIFIEPHHKTQGSPRWGALYWMNPVNGPPIIEMMMQANSEMTDNTLKVLSRGVGQTDRREFQYDRIQTTFDSAKERINLDTTRQENLTLLEAKGKDLFDYHGQRLSVDYFANKITPYTPNFSL